MGSVRDLVFFAYAVTCFVKSKLGNLSMISREEVRRRQDYIPFPVFGNCFVRVDECAVYIGKDSGEDVCRRCSSPIIFT